MRMAQGQISAILRAGLPRCAWLAAGVTAIAVAQPALAQQGPPPVRRTLPETVASPNAADTALSPDLANGEGIDPQSPLAPMSDMGVDWPDMASPDTVVPLAMEDQQQAARDGTAANPAAPANADQAAADNAVLDPNAPFPSDVDAPADQSADATADVGPADAQAIEIVGERRYVVQLEGLDDIADPLFNQRFREGSALELAKGDPANVAQLNRRAKQDTDLLDQLMRVKGYYSARIAHSVEPDPANAGRLVVRFTVAPGTLYLLAGIDLGNIDAAGDKAPVVRAAFKPKVGDPADADAITAGQTDVAAALGENGFPFAVVDEPELRVDHATRKADLTMAVNPGGYRTFGDIVVTNPRLFSARHVQRIARWREGDVFRASEVEDLRRALVATGLVSSVKLEPKDAGDGQTVNIMADLQPAPPHTIAGELGYGTGEGFRAEASWQHRNFFPPEGAITLRGVLGTQEQTGAVIFRRNNFRRRDQVLNGQFLVQNVTRNAYDARTVQVGASVERQTNLIFQKKWTWSVGTEFLLSDERGNSQAVAAGMALPRRTYVIGALPASLNYDGSDDLLDPKRGFRLGGRISPELSFQSSTFGYVRAQIDGSFYLPFNDDKLVLAARTRLGSIFGSSADRIAPSRRFYAGGGGSVRGYGYQDIGPRDANNDPVGGKSLAEFSLEARVRFGNFGVVPFVDAGNISSGGLPKFDNLRIGAGVGLRYYSSFGPIRIDVGTPINPAPGDPRVAVYVSLGQAF